jgi:hypothetical protein
MFLPWIPKRPGSFEQLRLSRTERRTALETLSTNHTILVEALARNAHVMTAKLSNSFIAAFRTEAYNLFVRSNNNLKIEYSEMKLISPLICAMGLVSLATVPARAGSVETKGFLKYQSWFSTLRDENLTGATVDVLYSDPNFPNTPDMTSYTAGFSTRSVFPDDSHEQYGAKITGWITPIVTGDYNFYLASDDASQLYISVDSTEANLQMVAEETACCHGFQDVGNATTTFYPLHLVAGQKYAVQILFKEGGGGDYVQVAMQEASGTTPAASLKPLVSTILSSVADNTGASLTITQQPVDVATPENAATVSFAIAAAATTPYGKYTSSTTLTNTQGGPLQLGTKAQLETFYQWFTNGVEVPGANGTNFTIAWPKKAQSGMKVKCYAAVPGVPTYSIEATLTVTADTTPPTVVSAKADATFTDVEVKFSEPVPDSALVAAHYTLDQGVTVSSVDRVDLMTVKLNTSRMVDGKLYTLTVSGVQDTATPANTIVANTQVQFKSFVFVTGTVLRERYNGFNNNAGNDVNNLFNDPRYPNNPNRMQLVNRFEYPPDGGGLDATDVPETTDSTYKLFFDTLEGWFIPPVNGNYVFFMSFADHGRFFLSTDESSVNKHLIMSADGWSDVRNWTASHDYNVANARSDQYPGTQWPDGNTIALQAGKRYYVLMTHHMPDWAGGQWFAATYKLEADADPAIGSAPKLEKEAVGVYLDPTTGSISFTLQPTNVTAGAGTKATFYAAATGSSAYSSTVTYQWQSAPKGSSTWTDIDGATSPTYTTGFLGGADDGTQFRAVAKVQPITAASSVATLTVQVDNTPPTVVKASTDLTWTDVVVKFSEPVSDTALQASHYQFAQGLTISGVTRVDALTVKLTVSKLPENKIYTLTINGVQDTATPPNTIAANTTIEVRSQIFLTGAALHSKYTNIDMGIGSSTAGLFSDPRFPYNPDRRDIELRWEYPANGLYRDQNTEPNGVSNRLYFDTIEGYFIPPTTGDYVFLTCGADRFWLYLSTDEDPANKHLIAAQPAGWTNPRDWVTGQGNTDITSQRSDTFAGTEWPNGNTITLQAGTRYYMLSIHHDTAGAGADDFAATYKLTSEPDPNNGEAPRLTGNVIGYYFDPSGASVTFDQQPQNAKVLEGQAGIFSVVTTGSSVYGTTVFYQWQSAPKGSSTWIDIPGATAASYKTPLTALTDDGTQFRVVASVPPYSAISSPATLIVLADTFPPVVSVGAMLDDTAGVVDIGVGFDETVDDAVGVLANYSVSPGTITGISVFTNRFTANSLNPLVKILKQTALLKVTGLSGSGTLTIRNVGDLHGNKITSTNVPFTVDTKMKWGVVGPNEFGGWNAVVPVGANAYDIYSDAMGSWATFDEATLVYEQVTGNFDKKLRVAYQDGSSQWARAALIVKEATAFGVDRPTQATTAARYQKCLVTPVGAILGPTAGTPGAQEWELNRRLDVGGATTGATFTGPNAVPAYPNAWCRIKRVDQTFTMYRSDDGQNWVELGSTTWGVDDTSKTPMPATVYVGIDYSPEIGNIPDPNDRGTFLAQFRDYGDFTGPTPGFNPQLRIGIDATGKVTITWTTGTLVSAPSVDGTYAPIAGAKSPYVITPTGGATFYRVMQ